MKTMRYILTIMALMLSVSFVKAEEVQRHFEDANTLYNEGHYDSALVAYKAIVDEGFESSALYYNMGNAYYKSMQYPMAILYYEKALQLDPKNQDILDNLAMANLHIADKIEPLPELWLRRWFTGFVNVFSVDTWAVISVVIAILMCLCIYLFVISRRTAVRKAMFFTGLLLLLLCVVSCISASRRYSELIEPDHAIIMMPTITVKSSPSSTSVDLFVLHEGTKVSVLDAADGWNKIKIANGSVGWLPANTMVAY